MQISPGFWWRIARLGLLCGSMVFGTASAQSDVGVVQGDSTISLQPYSSYAVQPSGHRLRLADTVQLMLRPLPASPQLTLQVAERLWVRVVLHNPTADTLLRYLYAGKGGEMDLYALDGAALVGHVQAGWFRTEPRTHPRMLDPYGLPIALPPRATRVYWLSIFHHSEFLWQGVVLYPSTHYKAFLHDTETKPDTASFFSYAVVGVMLFLALLGMVYWYYLRQRMFGYWTGYALSLALALQAGLEGVNHHRIATAFFPALNLDLGMLAAYLAQLCFMHFTLHFLQLPGLVFRRYRRVIWALSVYFIVSGALHIVAVNTGSITPFTFFAQLFNLLLATVSFLVITVVLFRKSEKTRANRLMLAGCVAYWSMGIPGMLRAYVEDPDIASLLPSYPVIISLGLLGQLFFSTLALSYHIYEYYRGAKRLSEQYAQKLENELRLRTHEILHKETLLQEQRLAEIETQHLQEVLQLQQAALRAQMNPHFIFNVLNSINKCILFERNELASHILIRFARLMRLVLENSELNTIPMQKELEVLRIYLEIEQERFGQKITYEIAIDPTLDLDAVTIPPMLLQPYIENSIWHGLLQKEQGGHISVSLQAMDAYQLLVEIEDNGVGRMAAGAYKAATTSGHKSFGSKITDQRLSLLNKVYAIGTSVHTQDLYNAQGAAVGTKVSIVLPMALGETAVSSPLSAPGRGT